VSQPLGWTATDVAAWANVGVAAIVGLVALFALSSDRFFRTRDALWRLLEQFERKSFHVRMWHTEQRTRRHPPGQEPWETEPVDIDEFKETLTPQELEIFEQLLGQDPKADRADLQDVYFFALRTQAWLASSRFRPRWRKVRLLNSTFGYQLLSTFLDHQILACRLRRPDEPPRYYPRNWGLLDESYTDFVDKLTKDLLRLRWRDRLAARLRIRSSPHPPELHERLEKKWRSVQEHIAHLPLEESVPAGRG